MDMQPETAAKRGNRKTRVGVVVSDVQAKTIVVEVQRRTTHPLYHKVVSFKKKYTAHDEFNVAQKGDTVEIAETRPLSKNKRWRLVQVLMSVK